MILEEAETGKNNGSFKMPTVRIPLPLEPVAAGADGGPR